MIRQHLVIYLSLLILSSAACLSNEGTASTINKETSSPTAPSSVADTNGKTNTVSSPADSLPDRPLPVPKETTEMQKTLKASLRRTPCYGRCPVYTIKLYDTGLATYKGDRFVDKVGGYQAMMPKETLALLRQKAEEVGYFKFADTYPRTGPQLLDLPACETYLEGRDGSEQRILNKNDAPNGLIEYEQYFDSLFAQTVWLKQE